MKYEIDILAVKNISIWELLLEQKKSVKKHEKKQLCYRKFVEFGKVTIEMLFPPSDPENII